MWRTSSVRNIDEWAEAPEQGQGLRVYLIHYYLLALTWLSYNFDYNQLIELIELTKATLTMNNFYINIWEMTEPQADQAQVIKKILKMNSS